MAEKKQAKTSKKSLTSRQKRLVEELAQPNTKSIAEAARKAGYSDSSIRSTVYGVVAEPRISEAVQARINRALKHYQVTPEEVLGSAVFQMRSSMNDLMDEEGYFDLEKARETGAIDLIKEIEFEQNIDLATNKKTIRHKVKFDSPPAARKEVANYIGLEKFESNKAETLTDLDLAKELLARLVEKRGWTQKTAISAISERFPDLDIKELNA